MQKRTLMVCALVLAGGLVAMAQGQDNRAPAAPAPAAPTPPMVGPATPGARPVMRDRADMLGRTLNLTEEQKEKIRPIFDEEQKAMQKVREETGNKLKGVLTPEQWEKYARMYIAPMTNRFTPRMPMTGSNMAPMMPSAPRMAPGK